MNNPAIDILGFVVTIGVAFGVAFFTARFSARHEQTLLREEQKLTYSVEAAIHALLSNPNYKKRSLKKIKHHLRGFETDNALRQALIRAGAVAFSGEGEGEMWGLISRNTADFK